MPENYVSNKSADHFHRYQEDLDLMKRMNMNALRFSIEWSRIQPNSERDWDHEAVAHYRDYLRELKVRGITPVVTLWHFTHPVWFEQRGGFANYSNLTYFVKYAERIMRELGREVRYVITINEPDSFSSHGYYAADWPPQRHSWFTMLEVYRNLLIAHNMIYAKLKKQRRSYVIGMSKLYSHYYKADDSLGTRFGLWSRRFLTDNVPIYRIKHRLDFIGLNFYFSDRMRGFTIDNPNRLQNDLGWDMRPSDIEHVLTRLYKKYKRPILVTENGLADASDAHRRWWLEQTFTALARARAAGVHLIGYLHWSLIDNFEWHYGFWPRFGLIEVDYNTKKRRPRKSAVWYGMVVGRLRGRKK